MFEHALLLYCRIIIKLIICRAFIKCYKYLKDLSLGIGSSVMLEQVAN